MGNCTQSFQAGVIFVTTLYFDICQDYFRKEKKKIIVEFDIFIVNFDQCQGACQHCIFQLL